jgi:serine phosphatase RsbU (regulator of sigma subunit)
MDDQIIRIDPDWPPDDIRRIVDALADGIVILDAESRILYLNPAAEHLLELSQGELDLQHISRILQPGQARWLARAGDLVAGESTELLGVRHNLLLRTGKGNEVAVELVVSVATSRMGQCLLIGVIRSNERVQLQRLTVFTEQLLDVLNASSSAAPAEQLLSSLCRRLGWDVAALWGLEPDGSLICRDAWTIPGNPASHYVDEKRRNPSHDVGGLAHLVVEREAPIWFSDLSAHERFLSQAVLKDGLATACAFPVRYAGQCLGAVTMMGRPRREPDSELIELVAAISGPVGAILHALEQAAERDALVAALEVTQRRLEFLLKANRVMSEATGFAQTLDRLAEVAVPALGDLCLIDVVDEGGEIRRLASRHADPSKQHLADELRRRYPPDPHGPHPSTEVMVTGVSRWSPHMSDEFLRAVAQDERHLRISKELSFTSYMTVPLVVGDRVRGTVSLVSAGSGRRYSERDLKGVEELAEQIAGVVEHARLYDSERRISHTLQQSLLPDRLPAVMGLSLAARYLPADHDVEVGGDWYDVIELGDGRAGLVVGDVQGHDMVAASVMGQLRPGLSLLLTEGARPGEALSRLNAFMIGSNFSHIATVLVAHLDSSTGHLVVASAGHPAPVLIGASRATSLPLKPGPPLGVVGAAFGEYTVDIGDDAILFFTDGLVERRDRDPDQGLKLLLEAAESSSRGDVDELIDGVTSHLVGDEPRGDDVAVLAVKRTLGPPT